MCLCVHVSVCVFEFALKAFRILRVEKQLTRSSNRRQKTFFCLSSLTSNCIARPSELASLSAKRVSLATSVVLHPTNRVTLGF